MASWPADTLMQQIAAENNLAETAFYVQEADAPEADNPKGPDNPEGDRYRIRWFTPTVEVDLCGHATLATAHVLFNHKGFTGDTVRFASRSGELRVKKEGDRLTLDFPIPGQAPARKCENAFHRLRRTITRIVYTYSGEKG